MKKGFKIAGIIVAVVIAFLIYFQVHYIKMVKTGEAVIEFISEVDLSNVDDGVYSGSYSSFLVLVELEVEVKDNKIDKINIIKQRSGPGYEGRQVINRIIEEQSLKVDANTGATGSSSSIILAVDKALH